MYMRISLEGSYAGAASHIPAPQHPWVPLPRKNDNFAENGANLRHIAGCGVSEASVYLVLVEFDKGIVLF